MTIISLYTYSLRAALSYRADSALNAVGTIVFNCLNLFLYFVLTDRFRLVGGWNMAELVFLYGVWMLGHALYGLLCKNLESVPNYVLAGDMDAYLTKPIAPLVHVVGKRFTFVAVGDLLVGVFFVAYGASSLNLHPELPWFLILVGFALLSFLVESAVVLLCVSTSFWLVRVDGITNFVRQLNYSFVQKFPLSLYGRYGVFFFTFVLPYGVMNFYPATILLERPDRVSDGFVAAAVGAACAFVVVSVAVFQAGIRRYTSTGS